MAVDVGGGRLVVRHDDRAGDELAADVYRTAHRAGIVLVELSPVRSSLEDRYLALVNANVAERSPVMTRIVQAELQRLLRRRTIVATAAASVVFATVATARRVRRRPRRAARPSPAAARPSPSWRRPAAAPRRSPSVRRSSASSSS